MRIFTAFFILFFCANLYAQKEGSITGFIKDKQSRLPVEFATVELLKASDSSHISGTVTDAKGKFLLQNTGEGKYLLSCSFIGYEKTFSTISIVNGIQKTNAGVIEIIQQTKQMQDITVTATKSLMNTSIDRKVYNVAQDIMSVSGSASDILKNVPSVEVDIDGVVSLRGSSDVMIFINGRPSPLMGKSKAEVLQQLPANTIERIEVITNPSAKYKPDGSSGIINIVLKKNIKGGWNGAVTANIGNRQRYGSTANLSYKAGKFNVYGNYSIRQDNRLRQNNINRKYYDTITHAIKSYYTESSVSTARPLSNLMILGGEYMPNKNDKLGVSGSFNNRSFKRNDNADKTFYDKDHLLTQHYNRIRFDDEWQKEKDATFFWDHNFKEEDHTLRIEINTSWSKEQEDNHYENIYNYPTYLNTFDNTLIQQGDNQQQLSIDYSKPISETEKLEAGYAGSFV